MYGADWKIKMVLGTFIGVKTDKSIARRVTPVKSKWELSDASRIFQVGPKI